MSWFKRNSDGAFVPASEEDLKKKDDFDPAKLKEELTTSFKTQQEETLRQIEEKNKPLYDMAASIAADKAERERARIAAEAKKTKEENEVTDEDFLIDPAGAVKRAVAQATEGTNNAARMLVAREARREYLEPLEYYHGDFKTKVDAMVAAQPWHMQARADILMNCYKSVFFDHRKDIEEGKIKAKNTSAIFEGGSTGGHKVENQEHAERISDEEKLVASKMGISEKDWAASKKELTYV